MNMRVKLVKIWRESVSTRITGAFHTLMSQRGVKGSMNIHDEKGKLILMVTIVTILSCVFVVHCIISICGYCGTDLLDSACLLHESLFS